MNPMTGYHHTPPPPPDLMNAMGAAGLAGDTQRLQVLHARYVAWLTDQGYADHLPGSHIPDEVWK